MKKRIIALLIAIMIIASVCFIPDVDAGTPTFNITNSSYDVDIGHSFTIKMNGIKANKIKWKSSNKSIATVNKKGVVKGVKIGTANITGKYKKLKFTITVNVVNETTTSIPSTGLYLGSCKNVDLYITKIDDNYIYLKAINKNDFKVKVDFEYLNFDDNTLNNIVSFDVAANNFRIYNQIYFDGDIPSKFNTVTGLVKIYDDNWTTIGEGNINACVN